MLVRKCGLDAVKEVMPAEHAKLLTNIRKLEVRKERLEVAKSVDTRSIQSKATTSRISRWKHSQIFSNFGDGDSQTSDDEYMDAKRNSGWHSKYSSDPGEPLKEHRACKKTYLTNWMMSHLTCLIRERRSLPCDPQS